LDDLKVKLYPLVPGYFPSRYFDTDSKNDECSIKDCGVVVEIPHINYTLSDNITPPIDSSDESKDIVYDEQTQMEENYSVCNINTLGYRKSGEYCSENGFIEQKNGNEMCDNDFECLSNSCIDEKCVEEGFLTKILNWFKRLFGAD
jgi:hypothetical protein